MDNERREGVEARRAGYELLAGLFLGPPAAPDLRRLAALPPFDGVLAGVTLDEGAVEAYQVCYQELFGFNLFPYESLFVERELMVNGAPAGRVLRLMRAAGFDPAPHAAGAADHLGVELAFMAFLVEREASARSREEAEAAWRFQAALLHEHLAAWAPVALLAMRAVAPSPFFRVLADITLELILSDLARPEAARIPLVSAGGASSMAAAGEGSAEEEEDSLNTVVRRLLTPVESGLFLTRSEIRAMAHRLRLPSGVGERFTMLRQLFEAAGQFDAVEPLLAALDERWARADAEVRELVAEAPAWRPYGEPWLERLEKGRKEFRQGVM